jgi:hypothetical protein
MFRNTRSSRKLTEGELIDPDDEADPTSPQSLPKRSQQRRSSTPQRRGSSQPPREGQRSPVSPEKDQTQQNGKSGRPDPPAPPRGQQSNSPRSEGHRGDTRREASRQAEKQTAPPPRAQSSSPRHPRRAGSFRRPSAAARRTETEPLREHETEPATSGRGRRKSATFGTKKTKAEQHAEALRKAEEEEEEVKEVDVWAAKPGRARRFTAYTRPELHERVYEEELVTREDREREDALFDMREQLGGMDVDVNCHVFCVFT